MEGGNYIQLNRKIKEWEWYKNINTKSLFIHMLISANWKDGRFEGEHIPRGSFPSSIQSLADGCGLTIAQTRTAIKNLVKTGELTITRHSKYSVFTVVSYNRYQSLNNHLAITSQSNDNQMTTIEEYKEVKKEKKNTMCAQMDAEVLFNELWTVYPNKKGKGQVSLSAKKKLIAIGKDELTRAIERYQRDLEQDADWRKPQNGSTFFNSGYIDYLDANYVKTKQKPNKNKFNNMPQRERTDSELSALERKLLAK